MAWNLMDPDTAARFRIFVEHLYRLDYKVEILERRMKAANDRCRRHRQGDL